MNICGAHLRREVLGLAAVGLALGLGSALGTSGFVASFLYKVKPRILWR